MVWGSRRLPRFGTHLSRRRKGKTSPRGIVVKFPVTPQFLKAVVILLLLLLEMLIQWQFVSSDISTDTSGNAAWPKSTPTWKYPSKDSSDRDVWLRGKEEIPTTIIWLNCFPRASCKCISTILCLPISAERNCLKTSQKRKDIISLFEKICGSSTEYAGKN